MSNNHPNRSGSRMSRTSYEAYARKLEHFATLLKANAERATPQQKRAISQALANVRRAAVMMEARHDGR